MDSISSSILFPMCEKVMNTALEEYRLVRDVEEEIRNLSTTVSMIKGVLADAEKKQVENGAICDWLKSLKQVLYDAEDVLDEIATDEALGRRDADGTCRSVTGRLSKVRKLISCLCNVRHASTRHVIAHQIKDINKKLDGISRLKDRLGLRVPDENSWSGIRTIRRQQETSSLLPNEAHMIGRDDEKQKIEELLLGRVRGTEATSDNYKNVHVVGVVGMGGVGKTTLVKQAYNNPAVTEYFQLRMWVCVSNDFDLKRITREIMDSASIQKVSNIIKGNPIILQDLSSEDLWAIFKRYAFEGQNADNHTQLALVGRQIVENLKGSPLAAKTIGRLLNANLDHTHYKEAYMMHDLIHDLAELVSEGDCLRLEDNQQKRIISETIRHVSIASESSDPIKIEELCKYENMRTLLFLHGCRFQLDPHLHNLFMKLQRLRVLGLSRCKIKKLPASIGTLKHLRLLDLSNNNLIGKLPESLCNLHNLQVLNLYRFGSLGALPRNMSALINLRHLIANDELVSGIEGVGKLTALHALCFDCGMQPMKELADMDMLRQLSIRSLEEVKSREEAIQSRLDKKEHLDELTLEWSFGKPDHLMNPGLDEEVLESLRPTSSIRRLTIKRYGGIRSPSWMEDQSWVFSSFLERLELEDCTNWEHHPLFLARLRKFTIEDCPKLRQLPPLPPTLKKLKIGDVGLSELPGWLPSPLPSSSSTSLSSLEINDCPNLTSLAGGLLRHPLPKLVRLVIIDCRGLVSLPETALGHLTSLKELAVVECPKLAWPTLVPVEDILPPSLENITIREVCSEIMDHMMLAIAGCQKLTCLKIFDVLRGPPALRRSLPPSLEKLTIYKNDQLDDETSSAWLQSLSSLRSLSISVCPGITSLPLSHLTALENLEIRCLNALKSFGGGIHSLVSLEKVTIERCPELLDIIAADSSPSSSPLPSPPGRMGTTRIRTLEISGSSMQQMKTWLLQCPSLEDLSISACPQLTGFGGDDDGGDVGGELEAALVNLSRTLQHLCFWGCENLRSLPPKLMCLSSLKSLRIISCPQIRSLPVAGLPESLQSLEISGCPALEERCKEGGGSDWPLLSHITELTRVIKLGISTRLLTGTS
ncbi:hypothetical protein Taro_033776 [Colocasia esculenta]|uniref:Uncharacterized protein n=1 Tax=Colocasia esculenta TaxID=4460 RepID=A0A843W9Y8_COLES|nr:hypothetical protein [Colocasia esculenta]